MDEVMQDKRFAGIAKDPRFRRMQRKDRKVKIDKRFQGMFEDQRFKMKYMVDKRGRPITTTSNENLRHFYDLSESESDDVDESNEQPSASSSKKSAGISTKCKEVAGKQKATAAEGKRTHRDSVCTSISKLAFDDEPEKLDEVEAKRTNKKSERQKGKAPPPAEKPGRLTRSDSSSTSGIEADSEEDQDEDLLEEQGSDSVVESDSGGEDAEDDDEDSSSEHLDVAQGPDYARGEVLLESSDDESDYEFEEDDIEHGWGELDHDAPPAESITQRLAVCNMDWDRIKAVDLMVLLNSFKPTGGLIHSVSIYPSEFGMKRLKDENESGPLELRQKSKDSTKSHTEGEFYHRERLRQYQFNRLKYYYAVVECDSAETANHIYTNCDGLEYEASATRLDLRFIADDMTFDQEAKSVERNTPDTNTYKPTVFTNTALQQSKVRLTWDETDRDRLAVTMRKFKKDEIEEMDVRDYLASDTDGDEDPYGVFGQQPGQVDEEDSEDDGGKSRIQKYKKLLEEIKQSEEKKADNDIEMEISWEPGLKETTEELVKKKSKKDGTTAFDEYLEKKREKTKKKRQEKQSQKPKVEDNTAAFSDDDIPAGVDLNDPFFKDELDQAPGTSTGKKEKKQGRKKKPRLTPEEEEEKKQEGAKLTLLMMDEDDTKAHFSLKGIQDQEKPKTKKKRKKKREVEAVPQIQDSFQLDTDDARFKALYDNPHFNIDPSAPEFKKTKGIDTLIESKLKRRVLQQQATGGAVSSRKHKLQDRDDPHYSKTPRQDVPTEARHKDSSLANLVKSVKAKTQTLQQKQKNRQKFGLH